MNLRHASGLVAVGAFLLSLLIGNVSIASNDYVAVILTALASATIAGAACCIAMFKRGRLGTPRHIILGILLAVDLAWIVSLAWRLARS